MGTNTLIGVNDGDVISENDLNQYRTALSGHLVPRNSAGVAVNEAGDLGTSSIRWKNVRAESFLGDALIASIGSQSPNYVVESSGTDNYVINETTVNGSENLSVTKSGIQLHRFGPVPFTTNGTNPGARGFVQRTQSSNLALTTSFADLPGIEISISSSGRPVMVFFNGKLFGQRLDALGAAWVQLRLLTGSTILQTRGYEQAVIGGGIIEHRFSHHVDAMFIHNVASGSRSYKLQANVNAGIAGQAQNFVLFAMEL